MVDCGDYGECRVDAETRDKAKYKAYLQWKDAYGSCFDRNPFKTFLQCIAGM